MANQEHLDILKQGVEAWNQWRKEHPEIWPDLSKAQLIKANIPRVDFSRTDSQGANFLGSDLTEADFSGANLILVNFNETNLIRANLQWANLNRASCYRALFTEANLYKANLTEANLREATFYGADLSHARLIKTNLVETDLRKAFFIRADLAGAFLNMAYLNGANFNGLEMAGTIFADVDLRNVQGLQSVDHNGPSSVGIDTIYRSHGDIPEAFLKGAGVDDTFITYIRSLVGKAIEYYSCFISYSSRDEAFAKRLYADLQSNNVRCWFAPEDLKIGDKFWHRIDESIRLYDKLLVVLSQHSVESEWVEREVVAALEKEQQYKKLVLFPIALDETFKRTFAPWAAELRRQRHIGDFTDWKNHDEYQKAFSRLLRDLKSEAIAG